jgi:hypothetical protein
MFLSEGENITSSREAPSPLHQVISFFSPSSAPASPSTKGVEIPLFLQDLFGLEFLPRQEVVADDKDSVSAQQDSSSSYAANSTLSELSLEDELILDDDETSELKKKKRSIVALASRMKQARESRKQRKSNVENDDIRNNGNHNSLTTNKNKSQMNRTWIEKQEQKLKQHKAMLASLYQETIEIEARAKNISSHVSSMQQEVAELEASLSQSIKRLDEDTKLLKLSKRDLKKLEHRRSKVASAIQETAAAILSGPSKRAPRGARARDDDPVMTPMLASDASSLNKEPIRQRAESAPHVLLRKPSSSFIRVHDLDMDTETSLSTGSSTNNVDDAKIFFLDNDVNTVLKALAKSGYDLATDESSRFAPALNTEKLLSQYADPQIHLSSWPIDSWHAPQGRDILVWAGSVDHNGFGCELPVIKARAIIPATPLQVLELIMDSSRAMEYNKMSQGRTDLLMLQEGIETPAKDSAYGVAGEIKVIKSLNKPPLLRRTIEMISLIYARPLENAEGYLAVNRSLWEDSSATLKQTKDTVRSEMILGVNVFRPVPGINDNQTHCELTTITHAHAPIVPDAIARKMGPTHAVTFLRQVQEIFA